MVTLGNELGDHGWARVWATAGGWPYLVGLAVGAVTVLLVWRWRRPAATFENLFLAVSAVLVCAQIGGAILALRGGEQIFWGWEALVMIPWPAFLFGVLGGFGTTVIDPTRPQRAGVWFWLRVPVMAFFTVGLIAWVPGLVLLALSMDTTRSSRLPEFLRVMSLFSAGCGLVAFLRFGGFNGAQHFLLRWLFARGGHLPWRPEEFFNHAARLALLQKVGLGYRFVHALLLHHLASPAGAVETIKLEGLAGNPGVGVLARSPVLRSLVQGGASLGLGLGIMAMAWLATSGLVLRLAISGGATTNVAALFLGVLMCSAAIVIPVLLLTGRWFGHLAWGRLAAGWLGLIAVCIWLARDEPARPPPEGLTRPAVLPADADQSYALLKRHENSRPRAEQFRWNGLAFSYAPRSGQIWTEFITARRSEIEANWTTLAPIRSWLVELNRFSRLAVLNESQPSQWLPPSLTYSVERGGSQFPRERSQWLPPGLTYSVWYPLTRYSMAMASLLALDGKGDEAFAILLPLLEVGAKLEEADPRAGYFQNGREMQSAAIQAAQFVLERTAVSTEVRARFARELVARNGGAAGAHRVYAAPYAWIERQSRSFGTTITAFERGVLDPLRPALDLIGVVAYNRQTSLNRWKALYTELAHSAAQRDLEKSERLVSGFLATETRPRFKNAGNSWSVWLSRDYLSAKRLTARQREYWNTEDQRAALHARLLKP